MQDQIASKVLMNAVEFFNSLPGVGKKTALRYALHLLNIPPEKLAAYSLTINELATQIKYCSVCHNISETEICDICANPKRDKSVVCVVQDIRDVLAIENTSQFNGVYHVLGGIISPMEGIGPNDLNIESFVKRVEEGEIKEVIFALSTTMEGETTNFYLYKKIKDKDIATSTIARGISVGDSIEYADEVTLGRSILNRLPYENTFAR